MGFWVILDSISFSLVRGDVLEWVTSFKALLKMSNRSFHFLIGSAQFETRGLCGRAITHLWFIHPLRDYLWFRIWLDFIMKVLRENENNCRVIIPKPILKKGRSRQNFRVAKIQTVTAKSKRVRFDQYNPLFLRELVPLLSARPVTMWVLVGLFGGFWFTFGQFWGTNFRVGDSFWSRWKMGIEWLYFVVCWL